MKKLALRYGAYLFIGFTLLFLFSHLLGISENYHLRILNGIIHIGLLYAVIRKWRKIEPSTIDNHLSGTAMGVYAGVLGAAAFTAFMVVFLALSPGFMAHLQAATPVGQYLTPITAGAFILMEGVIVSLIGSYVVTRYVDMMLRRKPGRKIVGMP